MLSEEELRQNMRETPWGNLLVAAGFDPYDTESSAREVARHAAPIIAEYRDKLRRCEIVIETMRPVWAQGYTDDSVAAQASASAIAELWQALGVDNQTAAMQAIRDLKGGA